MNKVNYGYKRAVVGAHYGLRDWLVQRMTGLVMAIFTIVLLVQVILAPGHFGHDAWMAIFSAQWMKFLTYAAILALAWHAWVGMRDIWMDYVQPARLRLLLEALTIVWLVGCAGWGLQVLWHLL
jgi:succinate dehydrogenase / fumarate reductase membrane anchor subunit